MKEKKEKPEGIKQKISTLLISYYTPADNFREATDRMSTMEVFNFLQTVIPSDKYTPEDVYDLLKEKQFQLESGMMSFHLQLQFFNFGKTTTRYDTSGSKRMAGIRKKGICSRCAHF
jgi:hypothetical protein